jgi:peptidoglycan hydrolase CwlO-like protein
VRLRRKLIQAASGLLLLALLAGAGARAADPTPTPAEANAVRIQEEAVLVELFALNRAREKSQARLAELAIEQRATTEHRVQLQSEIQIKEAAYQQLRKRLANRLRALQEGGRLNPIAILFGADSLASFLDRIEALQLLLNHDRQLMAEVRQTQAELNRQVAELQATEARLAQLAADERTTEAKLSAAISQKEAILSSLREARAQIEARLAELEQAWAAVPGLLQSLAKSLADATASADGFEPDEVSVSYFPPGATSIVSAGRLNELLRRQTDLRGLAFRFDPARVELGGQFGQAQIDLTGAFSIIGRGAIRFTPTQMRLQGIAVPADVLAEALGRTPLEIDLTRWIEPFHLLEVRLQEGSIRVRAGL